MKRFSFYLFTLLLASFFIFSSSEKLQAEDNPFGMLVFFPWNHDWNHYHYKNEADIRKGIELLGELGVSMVRMDFLWSDIEPAPGKYDFKRIDGIIDRLLKNDIQILGMVHYNDAASGADWNTAPDPRRFSGYAAALAKRYNSRIKYWEIWNEPDSRIYWRDQDGMKAYTELLKVTTPRIKEVCSDCKVLMGGVTDYPVLSVKKILQNGGGEYFDVVNIHPFQDPKSPGAVDRLKGTIKGLKKVLVEFGYAERPIWITEIGSPGLEKSGSKSWWFGPGTDRKEQAKWVEDLHNVLLEAEGVEKIFWAFLRDTIHFNNAGDDFGLVTHDFKKKPAFEAYRNLIEEYHISEDGTP